MSQFRTLTVFDFSLDFAYSYLFGQHFIAVKQIVNVARPFLSAFAKSDYLFRPVCPSVCLPAWNKSAVVGRIFVKFYPGGSVRPVGEIKVGFKSYKHGHVILRPTLIYGKMSAIHTYVTFIVRFFSKPLPV